ncbi:MAG: FlgD immunoglobulin-like domain containing protein [Armatimonadota bacterium]
MALMLVAAMLLALPASAQNGFRNTSNKRFGTRCDGPQGAIVLARQKGMMATAATKAQAVQAQHSATKLQSAVATYRKIRRLNLKRHKGEVRFPRVMVETAGNKLVQPDLMQVKQTGGEIGNPANNLTFEFVGWDPADQTALQSYLNTAYAKAKLIYGPPAFNITVKIIRDEAIQSVQGGTYNAATNEIRIPPLSGNFPEDTYVLIMLVLNAFHDDAMLFYDAWEQGMAGAAAYAIQMTPGVSPGYSIVDPGPFYCLSVYEPENQPELGNSTFYPASGATNMLVWRVAMARAAWQKCWIEDPTFFAKFNEGYYAAYNSTVPGDVPTLREIAAGALPMVEGQPFSVWFQQQYVLDTSVRTGKKLYTWNIPLPQSVALIAELYETSADGDETPLGGQARTIYWDYLHTTQLYAEEGNIITITAGGDSPGEGFLLPTFFNVGGPERITVQIDVAGLRREYTYPYGHRGFELAENNLYGAMLGPTAGTLNVVGGNGLTDLAVTRGAWGDRITTAVLSPLKLRVSFAVEGGDPVTRTINVGWDSYCVLMTGGSLATASHTFTYGFNGLHLMSLPLQPQTPDLSSVLGITANQLLLAWWDPYLGGDNKYRLWPSYPAQPLGSAYWLRVTENVPVNLSGIRPDPTQPYEVKLGPGWNLLGCPRTEDVPLAGVAVQRGDLDPLLWAEAVEQRLVQDGLYSYSQNAGYEIKDTLSPWQGYWVRCLQPTGVTLIFPEAGAATTTASLKTTAASPSEKSAKGWRLPLLVKAGDYLCRSAALGAAPEALSGADRLDLSAPPGFGPRVEARFVHEDWGEGSGLYCTDVRPANEPKQSWQVQVASTVPNQPVRVTWPDLSALPANVKPILYDPLTGKRLYMRTTTGYSLPGGSEGVSRNLVIETEGSTPALMLTSVTAQAKTGSMAMTYNLSASAEVTARVLNIAGRPVRVLQAGNLQAAGTNMMLWNYSDQTGKKVPAGTYLLKLTARGDDGREVQALQTLAVQR